MKTIVPVLVAVTLALASAAGHTQDTAKDELKVSIERKNLRDALNDWAQQTGNQLMAEIKGEFIAPKIEGKLTAQEALDRLLQGTPLTYQWMGERLVAVKEKSLVVPAALQSTSKEGKQGPFQVTKLSGDETREWRLTASDPVVAQNSSGASSARRSRGAESAVEELEEIVVTGTHIRGVSNSTAPVTILDKEYIESTGISTTTALIASLPQNFALANQSGVNLPGVSSSETQGSSINLRGVGEGTTLILLNGRRMAPGFLGAAVDISALPLTAIERVEVLTDGASAVYGSDAIGGVVNFVLRRNFDGAETRLRTGWADGISEERLSQALGHAWDSGNALVSFEYYHRDLLRVGDRDWVPPTSLISSLAPRENDLSGVFAGRQDLTDTVTVFADALYSRRDSYNEGGIALFNESNENRNPQLTATAGLEWTLGHDWLIEASGTYARNKLEQERNSDLNVDLGERTVQFESSFTVHEGQLKADGPIFNLRGGTARLAVGANWRSESFESALFNSFGIISPGLTGTPEQIVRSAFAELNLPLIGAQNGVRGARSLELSLAGRLDDYSNFGSSVDPRYGISWAPVHGFRVRASYGTSYKAPTLVNYNLGFNGTLSLYLPDPASPSGVSHQLQLLGANVGSYAPQESRSWSFGAEFSPPSVPDLRVGLNYYDIDYRDQIADTPPGSQVIVNPASFGNLIIRNPSPQQIAEFVALGELGAGLQGAFDPDFNPVDASDPEFGLGTIEVLLDLRRRNMSLVKTSGVDFSLERRFSVAHSDFNVGLNATYIRELVTQVSAATVPNERDGTIFNPPNWRARGWGGWTHQAWGANVFVNFTDSYNDNRTAPDVSVSSWVTVDANVRYDFSNAADAGFMSGVVLSLSAQNLFDRDPPQTVVAESSYDLGFDSTNASPMGRLLSVEVVKRW